MADTGAPWNLPYPIDTDLVRDGAQAIEDLADAVASGLSAAANAGIGSNVVQTVKTNTFTTTSTSFTALDGLSVTITPSSDTSKVLLVATINIGDTLNGGTFLRVTGGNAATFVGDAASSRIRAALSGDNNHLSGEGQSGFGLVYLDSPASASAVTYQVEIMVSTGTGHVNRSRNDTNSGRYARTASSIVAIEVAA
jgi:hypothetical protein